MPLMRCVICRRQSLTVEATPRTAIMDARRLRADLALLVALRMKAETVASDGFAEGCVPVVPVGDRTPLLDTAARAQRIPSSMSRRRRLWRRRRGFPSQTRQSRHVGDTAAARMCEALASGSG